MGLMVVAMVARVGERARHDQATLPPPGASWSSHASPLKTQCNSFPTSCHDEFRRVKEAGPHAPLCYGLVPCRYRPFAGHASPLINRDAQLQFQGGNHARAPCKA